MTNDKGSVHKVIETFVYSQILLSSIIRLQFFTQKPGGFNQRQSRTGPEADSNLCMNGPSHLPLVSTIHFTEPVADHATVDFLRGSLWHQFGGCCSSLTIHGAQEALIIRITGSRRPLYTHEGICVRMRDGAKESVDNKTWIRAIGLKKKSTMKSYISLN